MRRLEGGILADGQKDCLASGKANVLNGKCKPDYNMNRPLFLVFSVLVLAASIAGAAEDRRQRVLDDRTEVQAGGHWIYNDLAKGVAEATKSRKPMLVVFRCIP